MADSKKPTEITKAKKGAELASQFAVGEKDKIGNIRLPDWLEALRGRKVPRARVDDYTAEVKAAAASQLLPLFVNSLKAGLVHNDKSAMQMTMEFLALAPKKPQVGTPVTIFNKNMASANAEAKAAAVNTPPTQEAARTVRFDDIVRRLRQQSEQRELVAAQRDAIDITATPTA